MIQRLFQPFNPSHACCFSSADHPSPLSSLHGLCLLTPSLSFALISPLQTPFPHNPQPQPPCSTAACNYLFPFLTFLPSFPCPVFPLLFGGPTYWHCLCPDTAPAVPAAWLQNTSWFKALQIGIFLIFFFFKWKEGIIQEHGILITFSLKKIIAGFHKNFHKTSPSEAQKVFTAMIKA